MDRGDLERVVEESTQKLLRIAVPPVKYWTNRFVLQRSDDDPQQRKALAECESYPPRVRLLRALREDGTWPVSNSRASAERRGNGPPYGWTYTTMLRNLYELAEYKTPRTEGNVEDSLEMILGWQTDEGYIPGPSMVNIPETHTNGFALSLFFRYGMGDDQRVRKLRDWLMSVQRPDGGWNIPYLQDMRYDPQYRYLRMRAFETLVRQGKFADYDPDRYPDVPSCIWTTLMVIRGMVQSLEMRFDPDVRRGGEYLLDHFFKRNYHPCYCQSERNWTTLKYPTYHGSGLVGIDMLTAMRFGPKDPRMAKPVEWLVNARSSDSLWHTTDRPNPDRDQWISTTALGALARYSRSY